MSFVGRKKPYTARGIARIACAHCGESSVYQWQVCSNGNRWQGLCARCDIALNKIALRFMRHPHAAEMLKRYAATAYRAHR